MIRLTATPGGLRITRDSNKDDMFLSHNECKELAEQLPEKVVQAKELEIEKVKKEIEEKQKLLASLTS